MKTLKLISKIVLLFLLFAALSNPSIAQSKETDSKKYIKLQVDGLACPFCAYGLEKKLKALEGAENFNLDFKKGLATLEIPSTTKVTKEELKQIVSDAGFELKSVEFSDKPFKKESE